MNPGKRASPAVRRAQRLLLAGLAGGHAGAVICVTGFSLFAGTPGFISSLLAALAAIVFFTFGQGVQIIVADASAKIVMVTSMASYIGRVTLLGIALELSLSGSWGSENKHPPAILTTAAVVVISWLAAEFFAFRRLRIPVFDSTETP
jgi:hypothetical protein